MTLKAFLADMGIDLNEGYGVTAASDGFKLERDHVLAVSWCSAAPARTNTAVSYVQGANAAAVQQYTGISPTYYQERARKPEELAMLTIDNLNQLRGVSHVPGTPREIPKVSFLFSYTCDRYTRPWLDKALPDFPLLHHKPLLDVLNLTKLLENNLGLPSARNLQEFLELVNEKLRFAGNGGVSYSTDNVYARLCGVHTSGEVTETPLLEKRIQQLRQMWLRLLLADFRVVV